MNNNTTELEEFLKQYPDKSELESPIVTKYDKSIHLQFNGWAIILLSNGRYYFEDTSGG